MTTRQDCLALDAADPLATLKDQFSLPAGTLYLDGNSLGAMPKATAARVQQVIADEWGRDLIKSWNTAGWMDLPGRIGDKIGRLIGAAPGETIVADSTSLNLYKVLSAALRIVQADDAAGRRTVIVSAHSERGMHLKRSTSPSSSGGIGDGISGSSGTPSTTVPSSISG